MLQVLLEGKKTWIGLAITTIGALGFGDVVSSGQLGQVVDAVITLVGIVISVYGNFKAHQKIAKLEK